MAPRFFDEDDRDGSDAMKPSTVASTESSLNGGHSLKALPIKNSLRCTLLKERFADDATKEQLLSKSSSFSIDINPRLVLSSEELVETLITSGVGQYLEFTAVQHTYVHLQPEPSSKQPVSTTTGLDTVWEVPCSKKDVFQSKLLGVVEKRQLMKFLQFVADYGETHIVGEDVGTKNERSLALGRALKRPQNKTNQADDDAIAKYLDAPFQELLEKHFKLSAKLQQVVVYCVGLASFPAAKNQISGREGLAAVYRYVASIGRFTSTAFLVPLYGVSEIAQSFCRLCAVYGGIYVLRAPVDAFLLDQETNKVVGLRSSDGGMLRGKHVIINGSYVDSFAKEAGEGAVSQKERRTHGQILRGVLLLTASLRVEMNRLMVVIPPEDAQFKNPFAIQVVQLDGSAYVCPRDHFLVQLSMTLPADWIDDNDKQLQLVYAVMERLITSALAERAAHKSKTSKDTVESDDKEGEPSSWEDVVAWRVIYSMDHLASTNNTSSLAQKSAHLPVNLWPCETRVDVESQDEVPVNPLEIHLESASANARAIFNQLCPGEDFLPKSASAEQAEKEALEDEHDAVLQAAQKLAEQTNLTSSDAYGEGNETTVQGQGDGVNEMQAAVAQPIDEAVGDKPESQSAPISPEEQV